MEQPTERRGPPRAATVADVPALVRLVNAAYRVEAFFVRDDRTSEADIVSRLTTEGCGFLVVDDPGDALAAAVFVRVQSERGYFGMLSVDPARQQQGLGRLLVRAAEEHCRAAGCRVMEIDVVNIRPELPPYYAALGYVATATAPFPNPARLKREAHLVIMSKSLMPG